MGGPCHGERGGQEEAGSRKCGSVEKGSRPREKSVAAAPLALQVHFSTISCEGLSQHYQGHCIFIVIEAQNVFVFKTVF